MKKIFKKLFVFALYCIVYLSVINISASAINSSLKTITLEEIVSIDAMRSGQRDIFTFLKLKLEDVDVEAIQKQVLEEIDKIQSQE
tara:strand:- start:298 stop:555 length:258 start_codon:yes stop_codon:yes gene_type:complete